MCGRVRFSALVLGAILGALTTVPASAANWLELNFWLSGPRYDGALPECSAYAALDTISLTFAQKEGRFWNSALTDRGLRGHPRDRLRPWAPNTIPRRFCSAVALVSDGLKHPIHYSIGESTGMIGAGYGVEWCVVGLDRNWAYNPSCKMARP